MVSLKNILWAPALASLVNAAQLTQVNNFGSNPANVPMYIYVPDNLASNPAIIVAVHYCTGTAQAYYQGTQYASLADQHGFIVIYPESPYEGRCWDVSSDATLQHDGGGDSQSISQMVTYTLEQYQGDASRVFVVGGSSGAMMTNVLAATYPEMFAAGSVYAGVPAGCFYTGTVNGWNSQCANGQVSKTSEEWAQDVRDMYPGYEGEYPTMYIHHGDQDQTLHFPNYEETIKQWAGIFGYDTNPDQTNSNSPVSGYTTEVYGEKLTGVIGAGVGHDVRTFEQEDMVRFGIV